MSYQVLARKWRPRSFASLVGQDHVVRALNHALTEQRLHHAYLFTGTRGVGKTTIARIFAKSLNCETGITAQPCGLCSACQEIDAGRFVDLLEVDAATNTRVEEMRQLLENAIYAPTRGRFKVYVIDEVHMLSNSAFNAMLKTLEEPPAHVKFILATTDPQKIPVTVLSRCLQFNLKQMVPSAIAEYLAHILNAEAIPYESAALSLIAKSANGSMRDGLSILDQAIAHGAGSVIFQQVQAMLGAVDSSVILEMLVAFSAGDIQSVIAVVEQMAEESISFSIALQEMAGRLTDIQLLQMVQNHQIDGSVQQDQISTLAKVLSPEAVQLAYQIVIQGRQELIFAPDEKSGFVMVLMRLFAFIPSSATGKAKAQSIEPPKTIRVNTVAKVDTPREVLSSVQSAATVSNEQVPVWQDVLPRLDISGMAKGLAAHCELRVYSPPKCLLRLSPEFKHLLMKPAQDKVQAALSVFAGQNIQLTIELAVNDVETPATLEEKAAHAKFDKASVSINKDLFVNSVMSELGASIVPGSIKSIEE